ncbi:MAG: hypothetical protein ACO1QS_16530 [Verrucomicrobiota bacterium]
MHEAEQFEIPFDSAIRQHVPEYLFDQAKEDRKRLEFYTCVWINEGFYDADLWRGLPEYRRNFYVRLYEGEELRQAQYKRPLKRSFAEALAALDETVARDRDRAEAWTVEIRPAFLERKPCPIIPAPEFRWILDWALQLAQVPQECLVPGKDV